MQNTTCPRCHEILSEQDTHRCPAAAPLQPGPAVPAAPPGAGGASPAASPPQEAVITQSPTRAILPDPPASRTLLPPPASGIKTAEVPAPAPSGAAPKSAAKAPLKSAVKPGAKSAGAASAAVTKRTLDEPPAGIEELLKDPAKVMNQYVLAQMLGKGGMGQVWKAWDTKLTRWVALKFLTLADETNIKRFEREAKLAARLRHPNIAAIYEVGQDKGRHFIAMEFVDGQSLGKAGLTIRQSIEVISKIARALQEAHKEGIIHRDLKPDNLMVTPAGRPYVMDFGLAKAVEAESSLSVSGDIMGTPLFMSPEQARGEVDRIDARTDVYSLGATLYTLLTGEKPFTGKTSMEILVKVVGQEPVPPRKIKPEIPEPIEAVVLKAMEKSCDRRYPTILAFAEDLERFLSNQDVEAKLPGITTLILRRLRRNAWPAALGFVVLLAAVVGIVSWTARPAPAGPDGSWLNSFREERRNLEYRAYKDGDAGPPTRLHALLSKVGTLPPGDLREAADWFRGQADLAENSVELWQSRPRSEWGKLRDSAVHALSWCDGAGSALQDAPGDFAEIGARLAGIRKNAEVVASWRGEFMLRVAVLPLSGEVKALRRRGQEVPLKDRDMPLVLADLEIDDYEIELGAPKHESVRVPIPASRLKDGVTTTVIGDLRQLDTLKIVP